MSGIAIFGGTFNPVHKGHTRICEIVAQKLSPERIFVMPAAAPPHKQAQELASGEDRLAMCRMAFSGCDIAEVSDFEIKRGGKSYSYYTLKEFRRRYPEGEIYFIMGSDMLLSFDRWYRAQELLQMCTPVCLSRSSEDTESARRYAENLGAQAVFVEAEPLEISSTQIRKMIADKKFTKLSCYLDENVVKYIVDRNLYG